MVAALDLTVKAPRNGSDIATQKNSCYKDTDGNSTGDDDDANHGPQSEPVSAIPGGKSIGSSSSSCDDSSSNSTGSGEEIPSDKTRGRQSETSLPEAESTSDRHPRSSWVDHLRSNCKVLLLGQILSLLLASAGAAQATLHLDCGLSAPTFTMTLIYFGLAVIHIRILIRRQHRVALRLTGVPTAVDGDDDDDGNARIHQSTPTPHELENGTSLHVSGGGGKSQPSSSLPTDEDDDAHRSDGNNNNGLDEFHGTNRQLYPTDAILLPAKATPHSFFGLFPLHKSPWWYLMVAFVDVQANAVTMLAYRYTTLTSVTVFDALAIPAAMAISKCWLGRSYRWAHYGGLLVCMAGVVLNVLQDYESDKHGNVTPEEEDEYPHKMRGDLCAIAGGLLYGLTNVLTEVTVQHTGDSVEYLAMMGLFAFGIALIQSLVLEWDDILEFFGEDNAHSSTCTLGMGWTLFFAFACVTMLNYAGTSRFLMISEAAFFNLSLLTGDLWSVVFSIVAENIIPRPLFFVALLFILSGVALYEMAPSPLVDTQEDYDGIHVSDDDDMVVKPVGKPPRLAHIDHDDDDPDDDKADEGIEMKESSIIIS